MHPIYEFFRARYQERSPNFPWQLDEKLAGKAFAEGAGVRVPNTLQVIESFEHLHSLRLWDRCVVKPSGMHSAKGTFALARLRGRGDEKPEDTRYLNLLWPRRFVSRDEVVGCHSSAWSEFSKHNTRIRHSVVVEELVRSPLGEFAIPRDVKFYFVCGEPVFVVVINRNCDGGARYGYLDPMGQDASSMVAWSKVKNTGEAPNRRNWQLLLEAASLLAGRLQTPFASVDLYDADGGPVFGEFTPAPGGSFAWAIGKEAFRRFEDSILDRWWAAISSAL